MTEKSIEYDNVKFDIDEDVRGGRCPLPMLRAKRALNQIEKGQIVRVVSTDPNSHDDFIIMLKHVAHELIHFETLPCDIEKYPQEFHFFIRKG